MTESEWMVCVRPERMLTFLKANSWCRKARLFICACCRRYWNSLKDERSRAAVEWAEQYVEGVANETIRHAVIGAAWETASVYRRGRAAPLEEWWAAYAPCDRIMERDDQWRGGNHRQRVVLCNLLRDIFGNPFQQVRAAPSWLAWNDGTVRKMAQAIYEERRFADLPLLAGALEDAGCTDADILARCRSRQEHVRGCWVVDLLLGKS